LRTSQATFVIASRASWIDDVIDRSAAERKRHYFGVIEKKQSILPILATNETTAS
jgi:hypothetical protein